jgi:dTDP-4-dehydrorhamnose reductase
MNKIYLAGSNGFIGKITNSNLSKKFTVIPLTRSETAYIDKLDIPENNLSSILIYAAGNKNIAACEADINIALDANFYYLQRLTKNLNNPYIIYLSTDYVFNGLDGNYSYNQDQSPDTNYGYSKVMAEKWLLNEYPGKSIVLRVSAICSDNSSFIKYLLGESEKENSFVDVADNSFFSPTSINLLIECLNYLIEEKVQGIHHLSGPRISRANFAKTVMELYGKKANFKNKDYKLINTLLRPDLSLKNTFLEKNQDSDEAFFKLLNRVYNDGYRLEDFSEKDIIKPHKNEN